MSGGEYSAANSTSPGYFLHSNLMRLQKLERHNTDIGGHQNPQRETVQFRSPAARYESVVHKRIVLNARRPHGRWPK